MRVFLAAFVVLLALAPAARAEEKLLTLYSEPIETRPYVHDSKTVTLAPDGKHAPAEPGYVLGVKEMTLVDSKDPDAKPLNNAKFMVHHFVYFAAGRVGENLGGCWSGLGFIGGRGEEHPSGRFGRYTPPSLRDRYGIANMTASGEAPTWRLLAMVMNHVKQPKTVYVRTRVWYTTEPREPVTPVVLGRCGDLVNGMSYDVPGGEPEGAKFTRESTWTVPEGFNGRILRGASHQHGGADYQLLSNETCGTDIFKAPAYYGPPGHIYNTIRPILHEPGPIANGTFATPTGVPVSGGDVIKNVAVHDAHNLHVAAMGFWAMMVVRDDSVKPCDPAPDDLVDVSTPARWDPTPNHGLRVPQLAPPRGAFVPLPASPLTVGDLWFRPGKVVTSVGRELRWQFTGSVPHTVTVANGPRGFSSVYSGQTSGQYAFTPTVKGTYRLVCLVHPTTMGQTVLVK